MIQELKNKEKIKLLNFETWKISFPFIELIPWISGGVSFFTCHHQIFFFFILFNKSSSKVFYFPSFSWNIRWLRALISHNGIFNFLLFLQKFIVGVNFCCEFWIVWRLKRTVISKEIFLGLKLSIFYLLL